MGGCKADAMTTRATWLTGTVLRVLGMWGRAESWRQPLSMRMRKSSVLVTVGISDPIGVTVYIGWEGNAYLLSSSHQGRIPAGR